MCLSVWMPYNIWTCSSREGPAGSHPLLGHRTSLRPSVRVPLVEVLALSNEMPPRTISAPLPSPSCWRRSPRLELSTQHLQTLSLERPGRWRVLCFTVAANTAASSKCAGLTAPTCQCFCSHGGFGVGCRGFPYTCPGVKAHLLAPVCS